MQIPRRVEEMRAQKMALEFLRIPFRNLRQRNAAGVGGNDGSRRPVRQHPGIQGPLDTKVFRDCFNDPVAVADPGDVVFEVPCLYQPRVFCAEKCRRLALRRGVKPGARRGIPYRRFRLHNIQQQGRDTGVGQMSRNARTHGASSKNCDAANSCHTK